MKQDKKIKTELARWLAGGLGTVVRAGEIPPKVVSCQRCQKMIIKMGDEMVVEAATRTGVSDGAVIHQLAHSVPDLDATLSTSEYQDKAKECFTHTGAALVLRALDRASSRLASARRGGELPTAPVIICRNVFVLALLAYLPGNDELKSQLAAILECGVSGTDHGILEFVRLAVRGDQGKVTRVDQVIRANPTWDDWPSDFLNRVRTACDVLEVVPEEKNEEAWNVLWSKLLE